MSIIPDSTTPTIDLASPPACPWWCTWPANHEAEPVNEHGDLIREHCWTVFDDREIGIVQVTRRDEILDGGLLPGAAMVEIGRYRGEVFSPHAANGFATAMLQAAAVAEQDRKGTR